MSQKRDLLSDIVSQKRDLLSDCDWLSDKSGDGHSVSQTAFEKRDLLSDCDGLSYHEVWVRELLCATKKHI